MNIFQILCLLCVLLTYGATMDPARKGNENFPNTNNAQEEVYDSEYPGFNIHYTYEPKDWKQIESIETKNSEFLREIKNEIRQMAEDKLKIHHVLNIQMRQIEELNSLIESLQSNKKTNADIDIEEKVYQYLRNGNISNLKKNQNTYKIKDTFNDISTTVFENFKFERPSNFYFNLVEQWAR